MTGTLETCRRLGTVTGIRARCVLLSILLLPGLLLQAQFAIRVDAVLVSLDVEVFDSDGRPVTNLTRDDFLIYEDGRRVDLQYFGSADSPYDLILLSDCSASTKRHWPLLAEATARFLSHRKPGARTMIAAFGGRVQVIRGWKSTRDEKLHPDSPVCSGTRFCEALEWTIRRLRGMKNRRGVVVLTDGVDDTIPKHLVEINGHKVTQFIDSAKDRDFQKALRSVRESRIPFYFVAVETDLNPSAVFTSDIAEIVMPDMREMRSRLEQLAEASGGHVVFPLRPEDVVPMYEKIGSQLGTSYSLGYAPPATIPDGKRHGIDVRLRPPRLRLKQSRYEYFAK